MTKTAYLPCDCEDLEECDYSCGRPPAASFTVLPPEPESDAEVPDLVESICGTLSLEKDQCIVALAENGTGYIIARSDDIAAHDILMEDTAEDNNFNSNWDQGLLVGVYLLRVSPWSSKSYEGEYDCGIDVTECTPLWKVEEKKQ